MEFNHTGIEANECFANFGIWNFVNGNIDNWHIEHLILSIPSFGQLMLDLLLYLTVSKMKKLIFDEVINCEEIFQTESRLLPLMIMGQVEISNIQNQLTWRFITFFFSFTFGAAHNGIVDGEISANLCLLFVGRRMCAERERSTFANRKKK